MGNSSIAVSAKYIIRTAAAAWLVVIASGSVYGQEATPEINVIGKHMVHHKQVGTTYSGIPVEEVWLTHHVSYKDLDLKDPAGAAELRKRVQDTAGMACNELDKLYIGDISDTPTSTCVANAVDQAKPQVDAAIAKAMG